jgi:hypothetical protein
MKSMLVTFGLLAATSAFADTAAPGNANKLRALDTDGDRLISLAEAQAGAPGLATRFNEIDANHDGFLSVDEVAAGQAMRKVGFGRAMQEDFKAADADADGMLTRAEAEEMPIVSDFFSEIDGNADGYVTQDEIREHARTHGPIRVIKERGPVTAKE